MKVIEELKNPIKVIVHLAEEEKIAHMNGMRLPLYQVVLDPDPILYSPTGDHIRFNHVPTSDSTPASELHGWFKVESVVIDEVLEERVDGEWVQPQTAVGCTVKLIREEDGRATGTN